RIILNKFELSVKPLILNKFTKPNKDAIWVFGFQKSGTSAIAGLLAHMGNKSVTIDTPYLWPPNNKKIINGEISIKNYVTKYSYPFSKEIIKEPQATFFIDKIDSFFTL